MRLCALRAKSTLEAPSPALQQTTTPSKHLFPAASPSLVRMLWQTWHQELGGGERLGSGRGLLDLTELRAREPEWRAEPAVGSGGRDGAGRAGMAAAAGDLGEAAELGSGRGRHVRPALGSALRAPGPRGACGEKPPSPGVGACGAGGDPVAVGEAAGRPLCPPGGGLQGAGVGGSRAACLRRGHNFAGVQVRGQPPPRAGQPRIAGCAAPRLWALHLCECGVAWGCFIPALPETLL